MMLFWKKNIKQLSFPSSICLTLKALLALIIFCIRPGESSVLTEMEKPGKKEFLKYFYQLCYISLNFVFLKMIMIYKILHHYASNNLLLANQNVQMKILVTRFSFYAKEESVNPFFP